MGKLGKVVVLVFLISSLGMINLPSATADGVVDQSNVPGSASLSVGIPGTFSIFQIFAATAPGIGAVDIFLDGGDSLVRLDIAISGGTGLLETDFNPGCPCNIGSPVHVDFTGIQSGGLPNALSIAHSSTSSFATTTWQGTGGDSYLGGSAIFTGSTGEQDFFFRTYEGPSVAVGSISIPIDTTPMLVAGSEMNSVWITLAIAAAIGVGILIIRRNYFSAE